MPFCCVFGFHPRLSSQSFTSNVVISWSSLTPNVSQNLFKYVSSLRRHRADTLLSRRSRKSSTASLTFFDVSFRSPFSSAHARQIATISSGCASLADSATMDAAHPITSRLPVARVIGDFPIFVFNALNFGGNFSDVNHHSPATGLILFAHDQ